MQASIEADQGLLEFIADYPEYVSPSNAMKFVSDDGGESYNLCHCEHPFVASPIPFSYARGLLVLDWSNFEIADMNFFRSEAYSKFFDYMDSRGGFYYEVCKPVLALSCTNQR